MTTYHKRGRARAKGRLEGIEVADEDEDVIRSVVRELCRGGGCQTKTVSVGTGGGIGRTHSRPGSSSAGGARR
jgi:hypothetical protein